MARKMSPFIGTVTGEVLEEIVSSSNPGKTYQIIRGHDGVVYCSCWAWKKAKMCKHLAGFLQKQLTTKSAPAAKKHKVDDPQSKRLKDAVKAEVARLTGRRDSEWESQMAALFVEPHPLAGHYLRCMWSSPNGSSRTRKGSSRTKRSSRKSKP